MSPRSYAGSPTWVRTALSISSEVVSLKENGQTNLKNLDSNAFPYLLLFGISRLQGVRLEADPIMVITHYQVPFGLRWTKVRQIPEI